jgi:hypothetical protein
MELSCGTGEKPLKSLLIACLLGSLAERTQSTPIQRHVKVRGEANPYDSAYETYSEDLTSLRPHARLSFDRRD